VTLAKLAFAPLQSVLAFVQYFMFSSAKSYVFDMGSVNVTLNPSWLKSQSNPAHIGSDLCMPVLESICLDGNGVEI